jgi:hypothetical protein
LVFLHLGDDILPIFLVIVRIDFWPKVPVKLSLKLVMAMGKELRNLLNDTLPIFVGFLVVELVERRLDNRSQ